MHTTSTRPFAAIACGGTGGHLFPGIAIGEQLVRLGCDVAVFVSTKEIDQQAVQSIRDMQVVTLSAVSSQRGGWLGFASGFFKSYSQCRVAFQKQKPVLVLGMGGFASAPAVLAGRAAGAVAFIHDSNAIPGRANRWLAHFVDYPLVGFPEAASRLAHQNVSVTGTPVREQFQPMSMASCRVALGLDAMLPTLAVMGGSQGASGINQLLVKSLSEVKALGLQVIHLTGSADFESTRDAYLHAGVRSVVKPFFTEVELVLGAADLVISRSGASSLAEFAAMKIPPILIPYPHAADNHQLANARAFTATGSALLLEQKHAVPDKLVEALRRLIDPSLNKKMRESLASWHCPNAAEDIAARLLSLATGEGSFGCSAKGRESGAHGVTRPTGDLRRESGAHGVTRPTFGGAS